MTFYPSEQPTPFLPLLIADVSLEHSHRRTGPDGGPIVRDHVSRPRRIRRRLAGLATALLAIGR
jgi:hypothetical protein